MKARLTLLWAFAAAGAGVADAPADSARYACSLRAVTPALHRSDKGLSLAIDEPDDPARPTAWQGPIHLALGNGATCDYSPKLGIVSGPFLTNGDKLFFREYSGSNQWVVLLDARSCRPLWTSRRFGAGRLSSPAPGKIVIGRRNVALKADCQPAI